MKICAKFVDEVYMSCIQLPPKTDTSYQMASTNLPVFVFYLVLSAIILKTSSAAVIPRSASGNVSSVKCTQLSAESC